MRGSNGILEIFPLEQGYDKMIGHPLFNDIPVKLRLILAESRGGFEPGEHLLSAGLMRDRYEDQLREFAALLREGKQSPYSAEYEIALQRAILQASGTL